MDVKDFRKLVINSPSAEYLNSLKFPIKFATRDKIEYDGIVSFHRFIINESKEWNTKDLISGSALESSKRTIQDVKSRLENFINTVKDKDDRYSKTHYGSNIKNYMNQAVFQKLLPAKSSEVELVENLDRSNIKSGKTAYLYLTNQNYNFNISDKPALKGLLAAYEFESPDDNLSSRRSKERKSFNKIKSELDLLTTSIDSEITTSSIELNDRIEVLKSSANDTYDSQQEVYEDLIISLQDEFDKFVEDSIKKREDIESTYRELLKLKEPAEYWGDRAWKLKIEAIVFTAIVFALLVVIALSLYYILWQTPEGMLVSFKTNSSSSIKWSIAFLAFLSTCVFGVRVFNKMAFSAYHLARDAEEKRQLTYLYLSLLNESSVDKESRTLVLQSLFSRADSGLLKDDSGPTMPSGIVGKIFSGK